MLGFNKIRDVKNPERKYGNAGIDLFVPNYSPLYAVDIINYNSVLDRSFYIKVEIDYINDKTFFYLEPHQKITILGGLKVRIDDNVVLTICNKGGIATSRGLQFTSHIIDSSYEGELFYGLINLTDIPQPIYFGEKIVQAVPLYFNTEDIQIMEQSDELFYQGHISDRGEGSRGSTGTGL
jgi:dUTPase